MIEPNREGRAIVSYAVTCDACPYGEDVDATEFSAAVSAIKEACWRIRKQGTMWLHICPDCAEEKARS